MITAVTADRMQNAKESAVASADIINAGAAKYADDKNKSGYGKEQHPVNTEIEKSLGFVFSAYIQDFANDTGVDQIERPPKATARSSCPRAQRRGSYGDGPSFQVAPGDIVGTRPARQGPQGLGHADRHKSTVDVQPDPA